MQGWDEFISIVKKERETEIMELAAKAEVPKPVLCALVGAMTVARVFLEHKKEIDGGEVAACDFWKGCGEKKETCPFLDREVDECGIPHQTESDLNHAMKIYRTLWEAMPQQFQQMTVMYVDE